MNEGYTDIVNLLVTHGADVNKEDQSGKSALIYFIELLAPQRCKTSQVLDPLEERNLNILKSMLVVVREVNKPYWHGGQDALHIASSFGQCDVLLELIQRGANCNQLTSNGESALDLAYEKGHEAAVELLLKNGATPDRETASTRSIGTSHSMYDSYQSAMPLLCTAAKNGSEAMVKLLLKYGADINASDKKGNTAVHLATSNAVIEMLLNAGANVNATNDNGETVLSIVCEKRRVDVDAAEMLLKFGADPNICVPLHTACTNNDLDTVQLLLAYGADANLVKERQRITGSRMVASQKSVNDTEPSPLCIACKNGNTAMTDCLLQNGAAATFAHSDGNTPLHFAVVERRREQANSEEYDPIVTLLKSGAEANALNSREETPLYLACRPTDNAVNVNTVQTLLKNGSDPNMCPSLPSQSCDSASSPLSAAASSGNNELVMLLIKYGARLDRSAGYGRTALHFAIDSFLSLESTNSDTSTAEILLSNGA